ncbi:MAG: hypothetical protein AAGG65_22780, partial [Pseudomonadota bacterium]
WPAPMARTHGPHPWPAPMACTHGRAPKGERCRAPVLQGHWKTTTFVGALTLGGMTAPWAIDGAIDGAMDGAMDGEMLLLRAQTQLVPVLQPGDMVILDNLPAPQAQSDPRRHRGCRGGSVVTSALQPRLHPHRASTL